MATFATIIGYIVFTALGIAVAAVAISVVIYTITELHQKLIRDAVTVARYEMGRQIRSSSHWCSEEPYGEALLKELGRQLQDNGAFDINQVRESARYAKKEKKS
jgi:hypothetical protein